jgi:hypothetical protein
MVHGGCRRLLGCVIVVAFYVTVPGSAWATSLVATGQPDYVAGTVPLRVEADPGIDSVTFYSKQAKEATRTWLAYEESSDVFRVDLPARGDVVYTAHGFSAATEVWSGSGSLRIADLRPATPVIDLRNKSLVTTHGRIVGSAGSRATRVSIQRAKKSPWYFASVASASVGPDGRFIVADPALPRISIEIRAVARNGFGPTYGRSLRVFNLGATPNHEKYVLVDKSAFRLYVVSDGVVTFNCGCAIGQPWLPTPTGTFKLGKRGKTPNAVWGPWRLPLLHQHKGHRKWHGSSYYIHGTNRPSSIGHMASHGCVRLHNRDIRRLSTVINGWTAVIRD